jgi:hypothetical protein
MTTFVDFVPSQQAPFQFQATFDTNLYTVYCTWNMSGQRYYVNVYDLGNNLVACLPQVGSPQGYDINILAGYFTTSTLVWRPANNQFEISP